MQTPPVVSPQEWKAAREMMLVKEKAHTRARDALAAERRRMPWMAVEKAGAYRFETPDGPKSLIELFEGRRYSGTPLTAPDFSLLARAYGVEAIQVDCIEGVDDAIERAWDHDGCVVIDFRVEREANVFPIVPQGRSIGEMMTDATALPTSNH